MNRSHCRAVHAYPPVNLSACVAAAALLAGCASSGTKVTQDQISQFQTGVTTEAQVIAALGPPNNTSTMADGTRMDIYIHIAHSIKATSFIPVVGLLSGGSSSSHDSVQFTFDQKGVLKSVASSAGQQDVNTGLLNQK